MIQFRFLVGKYFEKKNTKGVVYEILGKIKPKTKVDKQLTVRRAA